MLTEIKGAVDQTYIPMKELIKMKNCMAEKMTVIINKKITLKKLHGKNASYHH